MLPRREFKPSAPENLPIDPLMPIVYTMKSTWPKTAASADVTGEKSVPKPACTVKGNGLSRIRTWPPPT